MAKYRHRIFEMYEFRDEAIRALTSNLENPVTEVTTPESWDLTHLAVSRSAGVTHVQFKQPETLAEETVSGLREDFVQLKDRLERGSKVLLDFTGVVSFSPASIDALGLLHKHLRNKGSRIVLCSLSPAAHGCFFATRAS